MVDAADTAALLPKTGCDTNDSDTSNNYQVLDSEIGDNNSLSASLEEGKGDDSDEGQSQEAETKAEANESLTGVPSNINDETKGNNLGTPEDDTEGASEEAEISDEASEEIDSERTEKAPAARPVVHRAAAFGGPRKGIVHYTSHPADIIYSASEGGLVASGTGSAQGAASDQPYTEHFEDSLSDVSKGATAVPDKGFHFVCWIEYGTRNVVSTSASFIPDRPIAGWAESWHVAATFAPDIYIVILGPNGGTATGTGKSDSSSAGASGDESATDTTPGSVTLCDDGAVRIVVALGEGQALPHNGGSEFTLTRENAAFTGWNAVANPSGSASLAVADGATLDAATEQALQINTCTCTLSGRPDRSPSRMRLARAARWCWQTVATRGLAIKPLVAR